MGTYTRQIFRLGGSVVIVLPKPWLDQAGLSVGDIVILTKQGGRLIIQKVKEDTK